MYTRDLESSTVVVPCNLTGSSIRIEAETTGGALVLCEVEAWANYNAPNPKNECDGCAWRLRSCAASLDHWDVDHVEFQPVKIPLSNRDRICSRTLMGLLRP